MKGGVGKSQSQDDRGGCVWPVTGDRGVKLPGFRQAQAMAVSGFCITTLMI